MTVLRALLVTEGVQGHQRISLGILEALRRRSAVEAQWLPIEELGSDRTLSRIAALTRPLDRFWKGRYRIAPAPAINATGLAFLDRIPDGPFDLVIGAGPRPAAPVIGLARHFGARSIYFGNPKLPLVREFDILLRPHKAFLCGSRLVQHMRPSEIDPDRLPAPLPWDAPGRRTGSFMVGGNKHWDTSTATEFAALIRYLHAVADLTVFNSRRTPDFMSDALGQLVSSLRDQAQGHAIRFIDQRVDGFMSNMAGFETDFILVTADSMSMTAEAVAARRPVASIIASRYTVPAADRDELAALEKAGHIRFTALKDGVPADPRSLFQGVVTMAGNHIDVLAAKLEVAGALRMSRA